MLLTFPHIPPVFFNIILVLSDFPYLTHALYLFFLQSSNLTLEVSLFGKSFLVFAFYLVCFCNIVLFSSLMFVNISFSLPSLNIFSFIVLHFLSASFIVFYTLHIYCKVHHSYYIS